jgi:hypothetical protein
VFTKPSPGWRSGPQAAELTASDGAAGDQLGFSVGMSSDGSTVVAGAPGAGVGRGAAYAFTKPSPGWRSGPQAAKLTASDGAAFDALGFSVGVSSDGSTVVAGAPAATVGTNPFQGAAYVFTKPSTGWATGTQAAKLTASDGAAGGELGFSVGASSDGSTVVAGAPGTNFAPGATYVFAKPSTGWATETQAARLTASDGTAGDHLGGSVGASSDGSTVVAGAPFATVGTNRAQGAAYVFGPASPLVSIGTPANGATYAQEEAVTSSFTCTEGAGGPGIKSCLDQTGRPSGSAVDTSSPGQHTFTVTATSKDGLTATATATYTVKAACQDPKAAFDEGFNAAFNHVWDGAFNHGFNAGFHSGFQRGFHAGFGRAGDTTAHATASRALPPACDHLFNLGFDAGWTSGFNHGFTRGFHVGYNRGFNDGFNAGHRARHHRDTSPAQRRRSRASRSLGRSPHGA